MRWEKNPEAQSPQPFDRNEVALGEVTPQLEAGLREWPTWSVGPIDIKPPRDRDLPTFRVTAENG